MSTTTNRPATTRWSSSAKSVNAHVLLPARKSAVNNSLIAQQHTFAQRTAKTRHDVEQLFKLYCTNNLKFHTFQRQVVTGRSLSKIYSLF